MNLFTSPMYNFAIMCPYKITYLLHSISILPSKYILRWKYILRNKNQLNLVMSVLAGRTEGFVAILAMSGIT